MVALSGPKKKKTQKRRAPASRKRPSAQHVRARYADPSTPGALGGVRRFADAQGLSLRDARAALEGDLAYTLHKPQRRRFPTVPVLVFNVDEQWVADLVEVQRLARHNRGIRYLLTVVDVLSKYAWVRPLKTKTGAALVRAFGSILKEDVRCPQKLQTDKGKEFYNRPFQTLLKQKGIHHFSTHGDAKAAVVERFNRTLKGRMYRYFTAANTLRFDDVLPALVKGYNASRHRSIGRAPRDVTPHNEREVWHALYGRRLQKKKGRRPRWKVGDRVRLGKHHRPFKKGYLPGWTEEVFVVRTVRPGPVPTYKVEEMDGTPLEGTFYEQELQKVTAGDDALFRIEKVLKRSGEKVLVRWKGWPSKYDSWVAKKDVQTLG